MRRNLPTLKITTAEKKKKGFGNMGLSDYSATNRGTESSFRLGDINTEIDESEDDFNEFNTEREHSPEEYTNQNYDQRATFGAEGVLGNTLNPEDYLDYYQNLEEEQENEYQAEINEINKGKDRMLKFLHRV
jgi:hypothetical protein